MWGKERCSKFMYAGRLLYFFQELAKSWCDFKLMYLFDVDLELLLVQIYREFSACLDL
jgi:hypothetical protein